MAQYSFNIRPISRNPEHFKGSNRTSNSGFSTVNAVAYILRTDIYDEYWHEQRRFSTYAKDDQIVIASGTVLPIGAPKEWEDPATLWNAAEMYNTSKTANPGDSGRIMLPAELSDEENIALCEKLVCNMQCEGYCVTWSYHRHKHLTAHGNYQPHMHFVKTSYPCNSDGFTAKSKTVYVCHDIDGDEHLLTADEWGAKKDKYFKLYRYRDEDGNVEWLTDVEAASSDKDLTRVDKYPKKQKLRANDSMTLKALYRWRKDVEMTINDSLMYAGYSERVSCESYEARGIDRMPLTYESPVVRKIEDKQRKKCQMQGRAYMPKTEQAKINMEARSYNKEAKRRERVKEQEEKERKEREKREKELKELNKKRAQRHNERQQTVQQQQRQRKALQRDVERKLKDVSREIVDKTDKDDDVGIQAVFAD